MNTWFQILITSLITLLIVSFFVFFVYKLLQFKTKRDVKKAYYNAMARMWFGVFLVVFGLNSIVQFQSAATYIIGGIFIILGLINAVHFNKARIYFRGNLPIEEAAYEEIEKKQQRK